MHADHRTVFIMPRHTRIDMMRMATFSFMRVGLGEARVHYTIPFPAEPDHVRIRAGRTFRPGWRGQVEQRFWHLFMKWADESYVMPRTIRHTLDIVDTAANAREKLLVFGGWTQLQAIALSLRERGRSLELAPGSLFGSDGGSKDSYAYTIP
jgi:hypothetical protein